MAQPVNPTTRTNPADILREALAGRSAIPLPQLIQQLRAAGMTAAELAKTFGNLGIAPEMAAGILGASTGTLGKGEFIADYAAALGKREGAEFVKHTGLSTASQTYSAGKRVAPYIAELDSLAAMARIGNLEATLSHARTHEQQVHAVAEHFAHSGSLAEAAVAMGVDRQKAEQIAKIERQAKAENEARTRETREREVEELRRKGIEREEAERLVREKHEARAREDAAREAARQGLLNEQQAAVAIEAARIDARQKNDSIQKAAEFEAAADNRSAYEQQRRAETALATERAKAGVATEYDQQILRSQALLRADQSTRDAAIRNDEHTRELLVQSLIKADGSATHKELALVALATGSLTANMIENAKDVERVQAKGGGIVASADDFDSAATTAVVAVADIKDKLAGMRNTAAPSPEMKATISPT